MAAVSDARPHLPAGRRGPTCSVCGEHGGDPDSVHFFHHTGIDDVSCSPFRIPVARLEAGRAALNLPWGTGPSPLVRGVTSENARRHDGAEPSTTAAQP